MFAKLFRRYLATILFLSSPLVYGQDEIRFFLPDFPPYTTMDQDGQLVGIGIDKVTAILDTMGVKYSIRLGSNHGRALAELRRGRSDGFFMASKNAERDEHAVFSLPLMINRWVWVMLTGSEHDFSASPDSAFRVASLLNTNTDKWLKTSGYNRIDPADNIVSLIAKLDDGAVDAVFVAEEVFNHHFEDNPSYDVILQAEKAFGIYISNEYLDRHPTFMDELNTTILELSPIEP
ncbi:substrate-binding periplasmic protein [Vibrio sp. 16]|uniref:substrate-binding periplasmic protein n=1 Tax=Vibrio sp. 16 TaxID=391586 RepID=UPI0002FECA56|nr:transporter substrate-binding domain-containing protein [Vibrio sp. 16]CAK4068255.1 hypothetical protein VDT1_1041 [Vibrio sp. 16]